VRTASAFRTNGVHTEQDRTDLKSYLETQFSLSAEEYTEIVDYLQRRGAEVRGRETFGIVYDITRYCNLECAHCCVSAMLTNKKITEIKWETTTEQVKTILDKLHRYTQAKGFSNVFLIFGGGEPTMRPDFKEIALYTNALFGTESVGVNTNGTYLSFGELLDIAPNFGFIEISIDGFENYHNQWRDPHLRTLVANPFQASIDLVSKAVKDSGTREKLEVSSAVTTENMAAIGDFVRYLCDLGVENYSIHRAMPVGRMGARLDRIPSGQDYVRLMLTVARLRRETAMKGLHLHHSLESIYSVLFLGRDIHLCDLLTGNGRHSIGLDPAGNVYFDPWCVVPPFNKLAAGNLLTPDLELSHIVDGPDSLIRLADETSKKHLRCRQCQMDCTGGMRFNALGHYVFRTQGRISGSTDISQLVAGLSEIDPACPLYED
jgi:MoaA/NifB/PqqE/SkfB family radical SAM enzyme